MDILVSIKDTCSSVRDPACFAAAEQKRQSEGVGSGTVVRLEFVSLPHPAQALILSLTQHRLTWTSR